MDIRKRVRSNSPECSTRAGPRLKRSKTAEAAAACPVWCAAKKIVDNMNIPAHVFNPEFDLCYCGTCAALGGHDPSLKSALRGEPAQTYAFPIGWCRFGMNLPAGVTAQTLERNHVAFHGTKSDAAQEILKSQNPQLLLPGSETESGFVLPVRSGHIEHKFERTNRRTGKKEMFDPSQIFMSPTIKYCEMDVYTKNELDPDTNTRHRTAFQVRIAEGSYSIGQETVGAGTKIIDELFTNDEVEGYTRRIGAPVLYGLLIKVDQGETEAIGIIKTHDINAIISVMHKHEGSDAVQEQACAALWCLANGDATNAEAIGEKGGIEAIISAMQKYEGSVGVQEQACGALGNLANGNATNAAAIGEKGGIEAIISAMQKHEGSVAVQVGACGALETLARGNDTNAAAIGAKGGIEAIISAMHRHVSACSLQQSACTTLWLLASHGNHNGLISAAGGAQVIVAATKLLFS